MHFNRTSDNYSAQYVRFHNNTSLVLSIGKKGSLCPPCSQSPSVIKSSLQPSPCSPSEAPIKANRKLQMIEAEKRRFYTIARGSTMECAAILDALSAMEIISKEISDMAKSKLRSIAGIWTKNG